VDDAATGPLTGLPVLAEGLVRTFSGTPVLAGVDLVVRPGEALGLLGPNGAGKTTLLRILALLLQPSGGRLAIFGCDALDAPPALRRRIGYLGHETLCYADLTAAENLAFYARLFDVPDAPARIAELLAWAGLETAARRPVRVYSRGMGQRLALARALLHRPDLLLLDEPFSGLDPGAVEALQERLADLRAAGHAIVLTTHDLERAAPVATRLAIVHRGRVAWQHDGPEEPVVLAAAYQAVIAGRA
jgi:heme exporter protein A